MTKNESEIANNSSTHGQIKVRDNQTINPECVDCAARPDCTVILKKWKSRISRRPAFIGLLVKLAMKKGNVMNCLKVQP